MKFCKDCRWFTRYGIFSSRDCRHPNNTRTDLVDGYKYEILMPVVLRQGIDLCGPAGNWWEPKFPFWLRVWAFLNRGNRG
jgi:hypothetical protein